MQSVQTSVTKTTVVLSGTAEWDNWYMLIRTSAQGQGIWDYVNPETPSASLPVLERPVEPRFSDVQEGVTSFSALSTEQRDEFKFLYQRYSKQEDNYKVLQKAIANFPARILETLSAAILSYVHDCETPYNILVRLRTRFAPTDETREQEVLVRYRKLLKAPKSKNLESWLHSWEKTYEDAVKIKLPDVHGNRAVKDFVRSLQDVDPGFHAYWTHHLRHTKEYPSLRTLIEEFRTHLREDSTSHTVGHGAFVATFQDQSVETSDNESERKKEKTPARTKSTERSSSYRRGTCLCGEKHRYKDCPYLVESVRKPGWVADDKISHTIKEKLEKNEYKARIVKRIQREAQIGQSSRQASPERSAPAGFTATFVTDFCGGAAYSTSSTDARTDYALRDSFILDCGATTHVCNNRQRFQDFRPCTNDYLYAGDHQIEIQGYGTVDIVVQLPESRTKVVSLYEVAFVPAFQTNAVSYKRFEDAGGHWATQGRPRMLMFGAKPYAITERKHGQYVVEYTPLKGCTEVAAFPTRSTVPRSPSIATADIWHLRIGHLHQEALQKLPVMTEGVKLSRTNLSPCETCHLAKAQQIVSRRPAERATIPFGRVHLDLIQMVPAFNGDRWVLHFLDDFSRMNYVYTLAQKSQLTEAVKEFTALVKRQYNSQIRMIRSDGERSFGNEFDAWVAQEGIITELSAPYTPAQNGAAERSGGVILSKARAIRIEAKLPEDLWPETVRTAGYLANRSPTRGLNWLTPLERLNTALGRPNPRPNLAHLKVYGCRAYPFIPKERRSRTEKLQPRAHIGYLVGYDSSNIYRVWIPSTSIVMSSRDVTFDESTRYMRGEELTDDQLRERVEEIVETIGLDRTDAEATPSSTDFLDSVPADDGAGAAGESTTPATLQTNATDSGGVPTPHTESSTEPALPTPEETPEPRVELFELRMTQSGVTPESTRTARQARDALPTASRAQDISADFDTANILESRTRSRRAAYLADLADPSQLTGVHAAFAAGQQPTRGKLHRDQLPPAPTNWTEMQSHRFCSDFTEAARREYEDLVRRNTFKSVSHWNITTKPLPLKWVFTYKFDTDGFLLKFKARICVRGDLQRSSVYDDNYAATLAARIFRALMAITAAFDLDARQFDAVSAFTNSALDEIVYCEYPEGFQQRGKCLLLQRALYGLRRSPLLWLREFSTTLRDLGLCQVPEIECLFTNSWLLIFFFVDDIVALFNPQHRTKFADFVSRLTDKYELRDLGDLKWFLGIRILRDRTNRKLWLCQDSYVEKIAASFHVDSQSRYPDTPMVADELPPYDGKATHAQVYEFQRKVGSLLYATTITRPDAARTANKLAEFLLNPGPRHRDAVLRAIAYLYNTRYYAIEFTACTDSVQTFACASDAAFADDTQTRKSTEGYLFQLFGGAIDWRSTKQKTVTTSSTEAELLALTNAAKELYGWKRLFQAITFDPGHRTKIDCDNQQTIRLLTKETPQLKTRLRHVDIHHHWLRQEVQDNGLQVEWVRTADMPADGLTKALPRQKHENFVRQLGLVDIEQRVKVSGSG